MIQLTKPEMEYIYNKLLKELKERAPTQFELELLGKLAINLMAVVE